MESAVQLALYAVAGWAWVWLIRVARYDVPRIIYLQQNFGTSTPRTFYRLARGGRWLIAGGAAAVGVACVFPEARAAVAVGVLAVAVVLLTYVHATATRLLDPRIVTPVLNTLQRRGDGPDEPPTPTAA
jgi:hypothetical protein